MATRNLTKQFLDIRNAAKANRSLRGRDDSIDEYDQGILLKNLGSESTAWTAPRHNLPPVWVDKIEAIEQVIGSIKTKIDELNELHRKRLLVNFESDESLQEREIDIKTQEITRQFHQVETLVKQFKTTADDKKASDADIKSRENIQKSVAKRVQALSQSFRQTQQTYMRKLDAQKSGSGMKEFEFLEKQNSVAMEDHGMNSQQLQIIDDTEELVNQRDEEITRIAKSIEELAAIFKELAVLVIDQGTILDRIDYNMETAVEHAKEGVKQLTAAEEHQKNAMPFRCIILLIILIIIMVAILAWKHSPSKR